MKRLWLTLAIDVFMRMIMNFHLLDGSPRSRLSVNLPSLTRSTTRRAPAKEREDRRRGPIAGLPSNSSTSYGADSGARPSCTAVGMKGSTSSGWPPGQPHDGGDIERLIGTMMGEDAFLPGTSFGIRLNVVIQLKERVRHVASRTKLSRLGIAAVTMNASTAP